MDGVESKLSMIVLKNALRNKKITKFQIEILIAFQNSEIMKLPIT